VIAQEALEYSKEQERAKARKKEPIDFKDYQKLLDIMT
jgi:hypothetical protein